MAGAFRILILTAGICSSQIIQPPARPAHYIEIAVPPDVSSEGVFIRYILAGEQLGGWIQPRAGVSSYIIATMHGNQPASAIKAILYAPGCALQTLDIRLSATDNAHYDFTCVPLSTVAIAGKLVQPERLSGRDVKLQAKYIARWAPRFLGLAADVALSIPVGDAVYPDADGRFRISLPDLSQDPLAGTPDHPGEFQIWAEDKNSGDNVARLIPAGGVKMKLQNQYPLETVFAPCTLNPRLLIHRDAEGFAHRLPGDDPCAR